MNVVNEIIMVPTADVKPYQRNPRKNDATVQKLVELIPRVGFNVPLLLDRKNVIVKGHTRWKAALRLGMAAIPCVYTDNNEETNKLDRIADNKVQEFSLWDEGLLGTELASLNLSFPFDLGILDFKLNLPSFDTLPSAAVSAPSDGEVGSAGSDHAEEEEDDQEASGDGGMTAGDLVDTSDPEYLEVNCDKCGNRFYVKP